MNLFCFLRSHYWSWRARRQIRQILESATTASIIDSARRQYREPTEFPEHPYKIVCDETNNSREDMENGVIRVAVKVTLP